MAANLASAHFREVIEQHIAETALGDTFDYDLAATILPGPAGAPVVAYLLILQLPIPGAAAAMDRDL